MSTITETARTATLEVAAATPPRKTGCYQAERRRYCSANSHLFA